MHVPFDINDAKFADLIVIGTIENYRLQALPSGSKPHHAQFEVAVDSIVHGKSSRNITVNRTNSTFALPDSLPSGPALIALGKPILSVEGNAAKRSFFDGKSYHLLQAPCTPAFILNPSNEVVAAVRKVLNGEEVGQQKLKGPLFPKRSLSITQQIEQHWKPIGAATAALLFFAFLGVTVIRSRTRKNS